MSIITVSLNPQRDERPSQMYDYTVFMGDLAYNYLAFEANATSGHVFSDRLGCSPPPEYTYGNIGYLSPPPGSVTSPGATYVLIPHTSQKLSNVLS